MIVAFIIWSALALFFIILGISAWKAKEAVGFFTGVKPPEIPDKNVKAYNHAVALLWFVYAILYECLGAPVLFLEQNSAYFVFIILGMMFWAIGLAVIYLILQNHFMKN